MEEIFSHNTENLPFKVTAYFLRQPYCIKKFSARDFW